MKTLNNYQSPYVEVINLIFEGAVMASSNKEGLESMIEKTGVWDDISF